MTNEEHVQRHKELNKSLDELVADFIQNTEKSLSNTSIMEFMEWAYLQTINPTMNHKGDSK